MMELKRTRFGTLAGGENVDLFTLKAGNIQLSISELGAAWTELLVPDSRGACDDVILGFSTLSPYTNNVPFFGATMGRYANRISGASFPLNDKQYTLYANNGANTLHGGRRGFDKKLWHGEEYKKDGNIFVHFELVSPDGEEGFPGHLHAEVNYGLSQSGEVIAEYNAKVDKNCPVNLTNHAYFNLSGEGSGSILQHEVKLFSSSYLEVDNNRIPTGRLLPVKETPFDFTERKVIGRDLAAVGGAYDYCWKVDGQSGSLRPAAEVFDPASGRTMSVFTTQPGVQFYTGNSLDNTAGKLGSVYKKHSGFCLETQHFPDSPNRKEFPSAIFGPEREYHEKTIFVFS
ncbi:MAG: galactose mutarotase [Spirochaetaceae bacterium]|nr:galactose mutarotase [Spirochaetaceae bacterium]